LLSVTGAPKSAASSALYERRAGLAGRAAQLDANTLAHSAARPIIDFIALLTAARRLHHKAALPSYLSRLSGGREPSPPAVVTGAMVIECVGCRRFVRDREAHCPFCGRAVALLAVSQPATTPRRTLAAALAIASFAACDRAPSPAPTVDPAATVSDAALAAQADVANPALDAGPASLTDDAQGPALADATTLDVQDDRPAARRRRRPAIPMVHVAPVMVRYGCPPVPMDADV
jgi:hypothetical protein